MLPRILVADDDDGVRQLLRLILDRAGFDVIEAASGEQALARAIDSEPSVILLDIMMPGMDGYDTCRQLKLDNRTKGVPVIFVSALEERVGRNSPERYGADDWIGKPIGTRDLVARVHAIMNQRLLQGAAA